MKKIAIAAAVAAVTLLASSSALASTPLNGTFVGAVKGQKPASLNGTWALLINPRGDYAIQKDGIGVISFGHAKVSGQTIIFQKEIGSRACKGKQAKGRYIWSVKGSTLTFRKLSDLCVIRRSVLSVPLKQV